MSNQNFSIIFIGGGNMARAMIGGLIRAGHLTSHVSAIEPEATTRERLAADFGIATFEHAAAAQAALEAAALIVWAVKPQLFQAAAAPVVAVLQSLEKSHSFNALHLSVAAGLPTAALARWLRSERIVRAMPNTPALIGRGVTGLFAAAAVSDEERTLAAAALAPTGELLWVEREALIDAVTAISGSGPAYVFYLLDALAAAGEQLGLDAGAARALACATFEGAAAQAAASAEPLATLRQRVTSPGGTTAAALAVLEQHQVATHFQTAAHTAAARAAQLAAEFGQN